MKNHISRLLDEAAKHAVPVPQISTHTPISLEDAYNIQRMSIARRIERGEKSIGIKLGFTSRAKMEQMGVSDMIWGWLTDQMLYQAGDDMLVQKYIHPRAEPEICFILSKDIDQELTINNVKEYIGSVAVAIEVIDSRYEKFKFSLEDVVADNCSSTALVVGEHLPTDTSLDDIPMKLIINGEVRQSGTTNAILGNPWESVVEASRLLTESNIILPAGSLLMAGAATAAEYLKAGDQVDAKLGATSSVGFSVK